MGGVATLLFCKWRRGVVIYWMRAPADRLCRVRKACIICIGVRPALQSSEINRTYVSRELFYLDSSFRFAWFDKYDIQFGNVWMFYSNEHILLLTHSTFSWQKNIAYQNKTRPAQYFIHYNTRGFLDSSKYNNIWWRKWRAYKACVWLRSSQCDDILKYSIDGSSLNRISICRSSGKRGSPQKRRQQLMWPSRRDS